MIFRLAWRNIWRHRVRSLLIMTAVTMGLWASIFLMGYYYGMVKQRINAVISKEVSHLQIHHKEFLKDYDLKYPIPDGTGILSDVRKMQGVKAAAGRANVKGMIATASGSAGVQVNGIDPEAERSVTGKDRLLTTGEYFPGGKLNTALVGEKLAKKLNLKLKSKVVITFQSSKGDLASGAFRISGIYKTSNTVYDEVNIFIPLRELNIMNQSADSLTEIAVLLQSDDRQEDKEKSLVAKYPDLEIKSWKEIYPEMELTVSSLNTSMTIFLGIILLGLGFGIVNTMLMAILERTREIGMLISLGMNKVKVFLMIVLETLLLVLTASPLGMLLGVLTVEYFKNKGMDLRMYSEAFSSFGYESIIYPVINADALVRLTVMVVLTALLSSLLPARIALRMNPVEALKK